MNGRPSEIVSRGAAHDKSGTPEKDTFSQTKLAS
jgi:hypothetical protein